VDGDVKFGAVDATAEESLGSRFGIRGFPTIKFFPAGARGDSEAVDYNGQRESGPMAEWALTTAGASSSGSSVEELVSQAQWDKTCKGKRICVVAFLPHITTEGKEAREARIETLAAVAKAERAPMFRFLWRSEAQQLAMEEAFGVQGNLPAVVAVSPSKKAFAVHRGRTDADGVSSFVKGLVSGRVRPAKAKGTLPAVATVQAWDGEDAPEEEEDDFDLAELLADEL
jgi:protein disulfide-isomerase A6